MMNGEELFLDWLNKADDGKRLWTAPQPWTALHTKLAVEFAKWYAQRTINSMLGEALNSGKGIYKP